MKKKHKKIYEQKTKEQAKEQPPETKVSRKHRNAVIRFAINQSRVTSPYTLCVVFYRSLCARAYGLEVNQNECRQAGKLSRLKIRKNHALRLRDWFARSRSASRRCERKNTQKTALDAPLISARSAASSLSPVRSMTSACDMMEYGVGAPSFCEASE